MLHCILACDLKGGIVVHGVKGLRDQYRPIAESSLITRVSLPIKMIEELKPRETYIADLDRIMGTGENFGAIKEMSAITKTMADTGIRCREDFLSALEAADMAVLGTETAAYSLIESCQGPDTVVSVDMKDGTMLAADAGLRSGPLRVIEKLNDVQLGAIILLDISRVGSGMGVDLDLVTNASSLSRHRMIVGGGVRNVSDLELIEKAGASAAIVASAVHAKKIPLSFIQ